MKQKLKTHLFNFFSFLLLLISLAINILVSFFIGINLFNPIPSAFTHLWMYGIIILQVIFIPATILVIVDTIKAVRKDSTVLKKTTLRLKAAYISIYMASIFSLILACYFGWQMTQHKPPQFFPFDDPEATYTVRDRDNEYSLLYDSAGTLNTFSACFTENGVLICKDELQNNVEITIGNSDQELAPFVNKNVKVKGEFVYSNKQCVAGTCVDIGSRAVINIDEIEVNN